jgi:hypothetical protein
MRRRDLLLGLPLMGQTAAVDGRRALFVDDYLIDWIRGANCGWARRLKGSGAENGPTA